LLVPKTVVSFDVFQQGEFTELVSSGQFCRIIEFLKLSKLATKRD
jgi:hypothetical protein